MAAATHNITAWYFRIQLKSDGAAVVKTSLVADYDDDGEAQAGNRLLHLITMAAKEGVAVMVGPALLVSLCSFIPELTTLVS